MESRPRETPLLPRTATAAAAPTRALALATISFTVSFAAWGLIGGLASVFAALYSLTASQTALLVAVPVLLGSVARIPMGIVTDRFGGRLVFAALLGFSAVAAFVVSLTRSYEALLATAFLIGHGRIVVCRGSGLRVALDPGGYARHGARRLRFGQHGSVARRISRARGRRTMGLAGCVPGDKCATPDVGGGLLRAGAAIPLTSVVPPDPFAAVEV